MQPINYGAPIYPNCFDLLTTHGVLADDVVGYITDTPSPYLQNYVAQRGWPPSMPGQIMPDPLPNLPKPTALPHGDVYQSVPNQNQINGYVKQENQNPAKKNGFNKHTLQNIATALLIGGLGVFVFYKCRQGIKKIFSKSGSSTSTGQSFGTKIKNFFSNIGTKIKNIFKKTP